MVFRREGAYGLVALIVALFASTLLSDPAWAQVTKVEKTGPDVVLVGENFTYTITVSAGTSEATSVVVADTLPVGVEFVSLSSGPAEVTCTEDTVADNQDTVICTPFDIAAGQQASLEAIS